MAKLQSLNGTTGKETIYVDVDDEITAIIDKVQAAKGKVIALVLPKRAPVLQSIVNMKLLKRTAENADKNLVLVTSEAGLMPLAGAVGLHVASTPTSRPSVPSAPMVPGDETEDVDEPIKIVDGNTAEADDFNRDAVAHKSIGELATSGAVGNTTEDDIDESIDMSEDTDDAVPNAAAPVPKPAKNKKLKVPNFDSFRKKVALGILGLAILVVAWIYAFIVMPKATVTVHTDTSTIATNLSLTLDTTAKSLDSTNSIVPASAQSQQKTATQQVPATGQQNNGAKATGTITVVNCGPSDETISAGTTFSAASHTFVNTDSTVHVPSSNFAFGGKCKNDGKATINVTALKGGADYNLAAQSYSISGGSSYLTASGSQMSGGTDNITKIVTQSDIDGATSKITSSDNDSVKAQLVSSVQSKGLLPVPTTFQAGTPQVTTSAKAGDAADNVTVTAVTTYTMFAVQKSDLQQLVDASVNSQLDKGKQVILDDGIANAEFTEANPPGDTGAVVSVSTKSVAGPHIDTTSLKKQLVGKKSGDVKSFIKQTPGVTSVDVKFSPLWVGSIPKNASKTTVTIVKAGK